MVRPTESSAATLPTSRRASVLVLFLGLWTMLWFAPWRECLMPWPWLRTGSALGLFLMPGMALHALISRDPVARVSGRVGYGFALSVTLTGVIGFVASLIHLGFTTVMTMLWLAGTVSVIALFRGRWAVAAQPASRAAEFSESLTLLPCMVVAFVAARLALSAAGGVDRYTQVARITGFLQSDAFSFRSIGFGDAVLAPPRYWLAFWGLCEAVVAWLSGVPPLEMDAIYLAPLLAMLSFIALFELARSLGLSRWLTAVALTTHMVLLIVLTHPGGQAGKIFFLNLTEDKTMTAAVLGPICLAAAASYWAAPALWRLVLVALSFSAAALSHPTSFGVTVLITCAYGGYELLATKHVGAVVRLLAVVAVVAAAASLPRFADHGARTHTHFAIAAAEAAGELTPVRQRRLVISSDHRYFAVSPSVVPMGIRAVGLVVLLVALRRLRRDRAARYVAGALSVVALTLVMPTAWIVGLFITPFHLWRVGWQAPFGIGLVVVAVAVVDGLRPLLARWPRMTRWCTHSVVLMAAQLALLLAVSLTVLPMHGHRLPSLHLPAEWRSRLYTFTELIHHTATCRRTYADAIAMGRLIDQLAPHGPVAVGDLPDTNSLIPSVSARARLVVFREPIETVQHAGITWPEAEARTAALQELFAVETPDPERLHILSQYRVEFVLHCGAWLAGARLATQYPDIFRIEATSGDFQLYRVQLGGIAAYAAD